jgi:hypothetical protein
MPYTYTWFDSGVPCASGPQTSGAPHVLVKTSLGTVHSLSVWQKSASELTIEVRSGEGIEPSGGGFIITHAMTEIVLTQNARPKSIGGLYTSS